MKKVLCMLMTAAMAFSGVFGVAAVVYAEEAGTSQTASAYLDQDGATVDVMVNLDGGWSVEFARGAVYLYEPGSDLDDSAAAMCITLDQEVYEGYLEEALAQEGSREEDGGVYYAGYEEEGCFIASLDDKAYVMITAANREEIEELVSRFTLVPEVFDENPDEAIFVTINTEGIGNIGYAEGEEVPEIDEEYPAQSAQINLAEPAEHTFTAWTSEEGWSFTKWTKDGEDFSDEPQITVLLDESADYVAVFDYAGGEYEEDGQNPVMNFVGPYACGRARAMVEAEGSEDARVTITWGGSAWDEAEWVMSGRFDPETLTLEYDNCVRTDRVYDTGGAAVSETVVFEGGTGRIAFSNEDLTFTWEDDQSEYDEPLVFGWSF